MGRGAAAIRVGAGLVTALAIVATVALAGCDGAPAAPAATATVAPATPADPAELERARAALLAGDLAAAAPLARALAERSPGDRATQLLLADVAIARTRPAPSVPEPEGTPPPAAPLATASTADAPPRTAAPPAASGSAGPPPADPARRKAERLVIAARTAWQASKPAGAIAALEAAEDADPTWPEPSETLGALLVAVGRPADALRAYERALVKDPTRARARAAAIQLRESLTSGVAAVASPADPSQATHVTLSAAPREAEGPSRATGTAVRAGGGE